MPTDPGSLFSWLHLSDIHFGQGTRAYVAAQSATLDALLRDISLLVREHLVPTPNAVFITGDIAYSAGVRNLGGNEYSVATVFLDRLTSMLKVPADNVFCVPGNHDCRRSLEGDPALSTLERFRSGALALDAATPADEAVLRARHQSYLDFVGASPVAAECRTLDWAAKRTSPNGLPYRVVGINSALLANDGTDHGKMQVSQVVRERKLRQAQELTFLLTHHPLDRGWVKDEHLLVYDLRDIVDVHFCGHVHAHRFERSASGGGSSVATIVAGAVHHDEPDVGTLADPDTAARSAAAGHGYSFGAVIPDPITDLGLSVRVFPRRWSRGNNGFRWDVDATPDHLTYSTHSIPRIPRPESVSLPRRAPTVRGVVSDLGPVDVAAGRVRDVVRAARNRVLHASLSDEISTIRPALDDFSKLRREIVAAAHIQQYHYIANIADPRRVEEVKALCETLSPSLRAWTFERDGGNGVSLNFLIIDFDRVGIVA